MVLGLQTGAKGREVLFVGEEEVDGRLVEEETADVVMVFGHSYVQWRVPLGVLGGLVVEVGWLWRWVGCGGGLVVEGGWL